MTRVGQARDVQSGDEPARLDTEGPLWVRVGGGLEEVTTGRRYGPADSAHPPPGGPWEELGSNGRLVGWARPGAPQRLLARRAQEEGERIARERRSHLLDRLGHKLRSSVLALQEVARQAAFGRQEQLEQIPDLAGDVDVRYRAIEQVALDPKDPPRDVVIGAVLSLAGVDLRGSVPGDAVVRTIEPVLVQALKRTCAWMGGSDCLVSAERAGDWWRLEVRGTPGRRTLPVPEMGEPLVRHLVDGCLDGWLDSRAPDRAVIYLPAG